MTALIRANRPEVSRQFPILGFTVRTDTSPAWVEVAIATDPNLFYGPSAKAQRTQANFYSSRVTGLLPAERGEAVYLLPPAVMARFVGQPKLYYALAVYAQPDFRNPNVVRLHPEAMPYVQVSNSFTGGNRSLMDIPNRVGGLTGKGNGYVNGNQAALEWGGDQATAGEMTAIATPITPAPTTPVALPGTATLAPTTPEASAQGRSLGYDDGFGTFPEPTLPPAPPSVQPDKAYRAPVMPLTTEIPLDPGVGGQSIGLAALANGDIILSTTQATVSDVIRRVTAAPVSHTMIYIGDGLVVEAIGQGVTLRPLEQAIADATVAVAFRHPNLTPSQAQIIRDFVGQQLDRSYNYWGIVRQALFQLDRAVWCSDKSGEAYDRCVRWVGRVNLGTGSNDTFFCSQLVLAAYEHAGVPLTSTPPVWASPGDLAELRLSGQLGYVGHLKAQVTTAQGLGQGNGYAKAYSNGNGYTSTALPSVRSLSQQSFSLNWDDVQLLPQPTNCSCWATAAAMLVGWRDQMSLSVDDVARMAGGSTSVGLNPSDRQAMANALGLVCESPQSYTIDGFRNLLETCGPLWVGALTPLGNHAVVVTGLYSDGAPDGSDTYVRVTDPWDRAPGTPGAPGAYQNTFTTGSRYILTWNEFVKEYEDRITTNSRGHVNCQILHAGGTQNRQPNRTAAQGYAMGLAGTTGLPQSVRTFGGQSFDVNWNDVQLVPQLTNMSCWAAGGAMIVGWRDRLSINETDIASGAGQWHAYQHLLGLAYADTPSFAAAWGLVPEAPQSYSIDGFRQMLEQKGPLWVGAITPMDHVIVVSGMYSDGNPDGSDTYVRILDPWGRAAGSPNVPGAYNPTPGQGSRYVLSWAEFIRQYEAGVTVTNSVVNVQIVHAGNTGGRQIGLGSATQAQALGRSMAAPLRQARALEGQVVGIVSEIAGAVMTRILDNEGDISWELDQLQGLKHPRNNSANAGTAVYATQTITVPGPRAATVFGADEIYANCELAFQYNGRSLGNIQIAVTQANDAVGLGLKVKANIMDDANAYTKPSSPASFAAIKVRFHYTFSTTLQNDFIAITDLVLYGDGTFGERFRWTQQ